LSVGVIIRLGRRARRHFRANPIASLIEILLRRARRINFNCYRRRSLVEDRADWVSSFCV